MTKQNLTKTVLGQSDVRTVDTLLDRLVRRLLAAFHEWQARRSIEGSLGHLSHDYLRDIGLTKNDVELACTDRFGQSGSHALKSAVQNRMGNW